VEYKVLDEACHLWATILVVVGHRVYLWLDVDDGHESGGVNLSDSVDLGAVHGVVVRPVLQVVTGRDVRHHLLVRYKDVVSSVFFVASSRPRRVCTSPAYSSFPYNNNTGRYAVIGCKLKQNANQINQSNFIMIYEM